MVNKKQFVFLLLSLVVAFLLGGWFFKHLPLWRSPHGEIEELYQKDGEEFGIFDNIPAEEIAEAEAIAAAALRQEIKLPEDIEAEAVRHDGKVLTSQVNITPREDIAGIVSTASVKKIEDEEEQPKVLMLDLDGNEVSALVGGTTELKEQDTHRTLLQVPVQYILIKNTDEYKTFKTKARGGYPEVDFSKQMLLVLETQGNLPDKVLELDSAEVKEGKLLVKYRVNILGLDKKTNTHTVLPVDKTELPVELKQVL